MRVVTADVEKETGVVMGRLAGRAFEFIGLLEEANLVCGRKPLGIAAGAVYAAGVETRWEDRPTQRVVASAVGVSTDVVCNRYQEFLEVAEANGEWESP